jgi:hypothetical protein
MLNKQSIFNFIETINKLIDMRESKIKLHIKDNKMIIKKVLSQDQVSE